MSKKNYICYSLCLLIAGFIGCTEMDDSMMKFVGDGAKVYAPKVNTDSVDALAGRDRLLLTFKALNPKVRHVKISWNNNTESMMAPVEGVGPGEDFKVFVSGLSEGSHTFELVTFDNFDNASIKASISGNVYGESYAATLKPRVIDDVLFNDEGNVEVIWAGASSGTIGTVLKYLDLDGVMQEVYAPAEDTTEIEYFKRNQDLTYRTIFLPETAAIDTFSSDFGVRFVEGPRVDLAKAGWTADASSFDGRNGRTDRMPAQGIDDNLATEWVNSIVPQTVFPHTFIVDLGELQPLRGFSIIQRQNSGASLLKEFEGEVSVDGVTWQSVGNFTATSTKDKQYFDFASVGDVRYFRLICKSANDGKDNLAIAEIGAFIR